MSYIILSIWIFTNFLLVRFVFTTVDTKQELIDRLCQDLCELAKTAIPKTRENCGRTFDTLISFLTETHSAQGF